MIQPHGHRVAKPRPWVAGGGSKSESEKRALRARRALAMAVVF